MDNICGKILKALSETGLVREKVLFTRIKIEGRKCTNKEDFTEENIKKALEILEKNFKIARTKDGYYEALETKNKRVGKLHMTDKGYGFVDVENGDGIYVAESKLRGCIHNDTVLVRISEVNGRVEGIIERRLARPNDKLVGEVVIIDGEQYIVPDNHKYRLKVKFDNDGKIVEGHKVVFHLAGEVKNDIFNGKVEEVIGHKNEPGVDILSVVKSKEIPIEFSPEALEELKLLPGSVEPDQIEGRLDLRDKMIFTIDGDDTKDIDDAISLDKLENGNYKLGVHIADVSHYIKPGMYLDMEARERGNSNYLADRVIPMFPPALSNGICSLNPGVDRLAISFFTEIDKEGNVVDTSIYKSVIHSNIQMTYKNVNKILEENIIPLGYEPYSEKLKEMLHLSQLLRHVKFARGSVDFDIDEIKIIVDKFGKATDIARRTRGEGEKIIEDFMVVTNEAASEYATNLGLPFLYRIHDIPKEEKIEKVVMLLEALDYNPSKFIKNNYVKYPRTMQKLLNDLKRRDDYKILAARLLRSMRKAIYSSQNIGHFGLASNCYSHLTSPIRRYADLENHRILKEFAIDNNFDLDVMDEYAKDVMLLGESLSKRERTSQDLEREVDKMKIAEYMKDFVGCEYDGLISEIGPRHLYVQLPNMVEGRINFEKSKDRLIFDEYAYTLTNMNKRVIYKLGMPLHVTLEKADKEKRIIDFTLEKEEPKVKKKVKHGNRK